MSQQELANESNTIREMVAKIENRIVSPQVNTLIKMLETLGYTIKNVPINNRKIDEIETII